MADTDPTPLRKVNAGSDVQIDETTPAAASDPPITDEVLGQQLSQFVDQRIEAAITPLSDEIAVLRQRLDTMEQSQGAT